MKKTKKTGTVVQAVRNTLYIMGFALRICPSRVVFSGIRSALSTLV